MEPDFGWCADETGRPRARTGQGLRVVGGGIAGGYGWLADDTGRALAKPGERMCGENGEVAGDQCLVDLDHISSRISIQRGGVEAGVGVEAREAQAGDARRLQGVVEAGGVEGAEEALGEDRLAGLFGQLGSGRRRVRAPVPRGGAASGCAVGADVEDRFARRAGLGEGSGDVRDQCLARAGPVPGGRDTPPAGRSAGGRLAPAHRGAAASRRSRWPATASPNSAVPTIRWVGMARSPVAIPERKVARTAERSAASASGQQKLSRSIMPSERSGRSDWRHPCPRCRAPRHGRSDRRHGPNR